MTVIDKDGILPLALSTLPDQSPLVHPTHAVALILHAINTKLGYHVKYDGEGYSDSDEIAPEWKSEQDRSVRLEYINQERQPIRMSVTAEFGGRCLVAVEGDHIGSSLPFGFLISDFFNTNAFPFTPPPPSVPGNGPSPLVHVFVSPIKVNDLITLYHNNVVKPLIDNGAAPHDGGSNSVPPDTAGTTSPESQSSGRQSDRPGYYSDNGGPMAISPPGHPHHTGGYTQPSPRPSPGYGTLPAPSRSGYSQSSPFSVGQSDLDPLGGRPAGFTGFPGSAEPSFGGGGDGGGMYMGPGHPLFGGGVGGGRFGGQGGGGAGGGGGHGGASGGVWGGDGWLGQGAVPPGARFDPVGPMNGPPGGGIGGQPARGRGAGGPLGLGSRDPDWNGQPPSRNTDYDNMFG